MAASPVRATFKQKNANCVVLCNSKRQGPALDGESQECDFAQLRAALLAQKLQDTNIGQPSARYLRGDMSSKGPTGCHMHLSAT